MTVLRRDHHQAAAGEIAEQHAEQERQAGGLQDRAGAVAVRDVADLVGDHAGQLVGLCAIALISPWNT